MSIVDGKRLDPSVFGLDERMRDGRYTDQYFLNVRDILAAVAEEGYRFQGSAPELAALGIDARRIDVGDLEAEMQCFARRRPFAIACGVDCALAILRAAAGYRDRAGRFRRTASRLQVEAVHDGAKLRPWAPALKIRGRYRDFAILETVILGVLTYATRVATRAYELLEAAGGKPVFFFPARFDLPATQPVHGYAYKVAVDVYNRDTGRRLPVMITTEAQGAWFGGRGGGTTSHSFVLAFLKDSAEAMLHFARILPPDVPRVALVDTRGDSVTDAVRTALAMFRRHWELRRAGRPEEARRYVLLGVRTDTAGEVRDASIEPTGDPKEDQGVVPRLVRKMRDALDGLHEHADVPAEAREEAQRYFRAVQLVVSGGFDVERIRRFESLGLPVDVYGVGSAFLTGPPCDFTADVVRIKAGGRWIDFAKEGRQALPNPDLVPVEL